MQGTEKPDRRLLDVLALCGGLVREGSVYRFLAENRLRLFPDGLFADLFASGRGRPSVPGSVVAVVMVGALHRWMRHVGHDGRLSSQHPNRWRFSVWHSGSAPTSAPADAALPYEIVRCGDDESLDRLLGQYAS